MLLLLFIILVCRFIYLFSPWRSRKVCSNDGDLRVLEAYDWMCDFLYEIRFWFLVLCNVGVCICKPVKWLVRVVFDDLYCRICSIKYDDLKLGAT